MSYISDSPINIRNTHSGVVSFVKINLQAVTSNRGGSRLKDYLFATSGGDRKYYPPFVGGYLAIEESSRGYGHAAGMRRRDILYTEQKLNYKGSRLPPRLFLEK